MKSPSCLSFAIRISPKSWLHDSYHEIHAELTAQCLWVYIGVYLFVCLEVLSRFQFLDLIEKKCSNRV